MEQAVNTFQKGLLLDSNPMVQNNDSLSNALNATFITMNGNEVVLQNDMGNRRVDNAYLPSGYVPVGMKEYGGIIYVAAYNPLTNTSQVGSFPSPERNMGLEYDDLNADINDIKNYFLNSNDVIKINNAPIDNYYFTDKESHLIPLTNNITIHPGDKFTVYFLNDDSNEYPSWINNVSNYNNTEDLDDDTNNTHIHKVYSPKNKQYTLSIGVLNSLNEFVDITKNLLRWKDEEVVEEFENNSDLYKFNYGYFIPTLNLSQVNNLSLTIDDLNFWNNRNSQAVNTYAYKLVGPLCLKITLNHIQTFDYTLLAYKEENSNNTYDISIKIVGTITYNCPDILVNGNEGNDIYHTFEIKKPTSISPTSYFNLFTTKLEDDPVVEINENEINYDEINNIYTVTLTKTYKLEGYYENSKINYGLGCLTFKDDNNYYLKNLWHEGVIDVSELNSGIVKMTEWRFYNMWDEKSDNAGFYISCNFDTYPKFDLTFSNLRIKINGITKHISDTVGSINDVYLEWSDFDLNPQEVYEVLFLYDTNYSDEHSELQRFFVTTNVFNEHYMFGDDNFEKDYNIFLESNKHKIIKITPDILCETTITPTYDNSAVNTLFDKTKNSSGEAEDIELEFESIYDLSYNIKGTNFVYDELKYPKDIVSVSSSNLSYHIKRDQISLFPLSTETVGNISKNWTYPGKYASNRSNVTSYSETITLTEYFRAKPDETSELHNVFITLKDALEHQMSESDFKYAGFYMGFHVNLDGDATDDLKKVYMLFLPHDAKATNQSDNEKYSIIRDYTLVSTCDLNNRRNVIANSSNNGIQQDVNHYELYSRLSDDDWNNWTYRPYEINNAFFNNAQNVNFSFLFVSSNTIKNNNDAEEGSKTSENFQRFYETDKPNPTMKKSGLLNTYKTFLFWKYDTNSWCLYNELISLNVNIIKDDNITYGGDITVTKNDTNPLIKLFEDHNLSKIKFAYYNNLKLSDSNYYTINRNNYIKTIPYSVKFDVIYSITNPAMPDPQIRDLNWISANTTNFRSGDDTLKYTSIFIAEIDNNNKSKTHHIELKANSLTDDGDIMKALLERKNMDLKGRLSDDEGEDLDVNSFYYLIGEEDDSDSKLHKVSLTSLKVGNSGGDYRELWPASTKTISAYPTYKSLATGQDGDEGNHEHQIYIRFNEDVVISNPLENFNSGLYDNITSSSSSSSSSSSTNNNSSSGDSSSGGLSGDSSSGGSSYSTPGSEGKFVGHHDPFVLNDGSGYTVKL